MTWSQTRGGAVDAQRRESCRLNTPPPPAPTQGQRNPQVLSDTGLGADEGCAQCYPEGESAWR